MEVSVSRDLLLSLSESIAFHRLPNLETIAVITKAKGANVYSWDDRRGYLCFARQKRVCIFRHDGGRGFVEVKEFAVPDMVKSMAWCSENICLGIWREYMIFNASNGALSEVFPSGRIAPPLLVSLPSGELLLGKDNIGVFVDQNGKLLQEGWICWSEAPQAVIIHKPPAIALLPRYFEIRSFRVPYPLIQTVVLRNDNSVYGLFPVPLGAQPYVSCFHRRIQICELQGRPRFILVVVTDTEKLMDIGCDASYLSRGSSGISDDMESSIPSQQSESEENAALESKKLSDNTLMALIKLLQKKRYTIIEKATAEGTEEVVLGAADDNYVSYDSSRSKKSNKGRCTIAISSGAREMAAVLDTALLRALLLTGQSSAALELLKGLNYCDVKICEEFLQKANHYAALLELYRCDGMHHEALKLLHQLVEESKSEQPQMEITQKFRPEMIIISSCPNQTIELFLSGNIQADLVNSYLKQHVQIYLSEVLEWQSELSAQKKWDERAYSPTGKKLLSALESISGYNPEALLQRLP
ncbi:Vacuolar sorting protein 39/Transforming growth factor beta receptor-associated domain 1 [Dillenia turbinata]|uniref:Vacuolar sorting protein 39/Transforming growth factor beta receptor-associated domain 1 n=1 Tax=Dillenia turbinata TaxID=194707 RepID=A0AAN8V6G9_9MAGN